MYQETRFSQLSDDEWGILYAAFTTGLARRVQGGEDIGDGLILSVEQIRSFHQECMNRTVITCVEPHPDHIEQPQVGQSEGAVLSAWHRHNRDVASHAEARRKALETQDAVYRLKAKAARSFVNLLLVGLRPALSFLETDEFVRQCEEEVDAGLEENDVNDWFEDDHDLPKFIPPADCK